MKYNRTPIIDAHQHFWDPADLQLPELTGKYQPLGRAFLPEELKREITACGIDYTVLVQGLPQEDSTNDWYFETIQGCDFIAGVVAWADMTNPKEFCNALDRLQKQAKFVGIRHIVEMENAPDWINQPSVIESLRELGARNLTFDLCANPKHLPCLAKTLHQVRNTRIVIDHLAKPEIKNKRVDKWEPYLRQTAEYPNVYCKLSGMLTEADWQGWKVSDFEPYVAKAMEFFGSDRLMFGSDWPVCLLAGGYRDTVDSVKGNLGGISEGERAKIFGLNAIKFYNLELQD